MATVVRMPSPLAGATEGAIQSWLARIGQQIAVGEPLAEIETEKAVVEYASEIEGTVARLLVEPGENVEVGTPIAVILGPGENDAAVESALAEVGIAAGEDAAATSQASRLLNGTAASTTPVSGMTPGGTASNATVIHATGPLSSAADSPLIQSDTRVFMSPLVRRMARQRGISLEHVEGTGPSGRIVRRDLETLLANNARSSEGSTPNTALTPDAPKTETPAPGSPLATAPISGFTDVPITGMRRAIARRLTESKTSVPHFYVTAHCRVDALQELRRQLNQSAPRKISVNDFVLKAVAGALTKVPAANAIWNGDAIREFQQVDIAVAVAVDGGLLTPVLRGVDTMSIGAVSARVAELAERARLGRLQQKDLEGGSFSVSNLGMYKVTEFSAILNPPQAGILAVGAAQPRPIVENGAIAVGTMMTVTLSADHRVIDGAVAGEWMSAFQALIESPLGILT